VRQGAKLCVGFLALLAYCLASSAAAGESYPAWRASAAQTLAARNDAHSLATAAALTFVGPATRSRAETAKAASAALEFAVKASELAPDDAALGWLRLRLCADAAGCDLRDTATTMRWIDADNGAAWIPTLAVAQKDRDAVEIDRVLADMARGTRFDLYGDRTTVFFFDSLRRVRGNLPAEYLKTDLARLTEAVGLAAAVTVPSFSPLINACRDTADSERREPCLKLAKTMQRADAVLAQLVGFAIEKRLAPPDSKESRTVLERRRLLEWRVAEANQSEEPVLPWLRNARARSRLAKMRALPREEDVYIAVLREHKLPLQPARDHR
jgi:hypothetical protein